MADYRDNFDTHPRIHPHKGDERASFTGPLIALGVILALFLGIFLMSSGTGDIDINADSPPAAAESAPATR